MPSFKQTLYTLIAATSVAQAANHDVTIGRLVFVPNNTLAAVGDTVTFHFTNNNHDVVQGSFSTPCEHSTGGFYSGLDVANKQFVVTVNSTDPLYFYCGVTGHCQGGMVGAINGPSSSNTLEQYSAAAAGTSRSTQPDAVAGGVLAANVSPSASASGSASASASGSAVASASASASRSASASASAASASASASQTPSAGNKVVGDNIVIAAVALAGGFFAAGLV